MRTIQTILNIHAVIMNNSMPVLNAHVLHALMSLVLVSMAVMTRLRHHQRISSRCSRSRHRPATRDRFFKYCREKLANDIGREAARRHSTPAQPLLLVCLLCLFCCSGTLSRTTLSSAFALPTDDQLEAASIARLGVQDPAHESSLPKAQLV